MAKSSLNTKVTDDTDAVYISEAQPNTVIDSRNYQCNSTINLHTLRQTRLKLRKLLLGQNTQFAINCIGDSWSYDPSYTSPLARELRRLYGNAGHGSVQTISPRLASNASGSGYTIAASGSWTNTTHTRSTPDLGVSVSSTAGSRMTTTGPTGAIDKAFLFYEPSADGQAQYRWNGGAWMPIALTSGTGIARVDITAGAPSSGRWTLEIEVVSGECRLSIIDLRSNAAGVRVNKLGDSGSQARTWAAATAETWQAGQALLAPDLFIIMLGTNDQVRRNPDLLPADLLTIATRCKAAVPSADVLLMQPPENLLGRSTLMKDLTAAVRDMAIANDIAFIDMQHYFGPADNPSFYASDGAFPLMRPDNVHPNNDGSLMLADVALRVLTSSF
jgi:lysophospholipase L1-like esterase